MLAPGELAHWVGFAVQGDFGPYTTYTDKHGNLVWFARKQLRDPDTPAKLAQQDRFRQAAQVWNQLTIEKRRDWSQMAYTLSLPLTGYNVFTWYQLKGEDAAIKTLERQSGLTLLPVPRIPKP